MIIGTVNINWCNVIALFFKPKITVKKCVCGLNVLRVKIHNIYNTI